MRNDSRIMSFGDHLEDLRKRLFWAVAGPVPVFIACVVFGKYLLEFIVAPLIDALKRAGEAPHLIATSPVEPFAAYMKVAAVVTVLVAMPWILYQIWLFVAPGLYAKERRFIYFLLPLSTVLTSIGLAFLYWVLLPLSLVFLIEFGAGLVTPNIEKAEPPAGLVVPEIPVLGYDPATPKPGQMWINKSIDQMRIAVGEGADLKVMSLNLHSGAGVSQEYRLSEYIDLVFLLGLAFAVAFQLPIVLMLLSWTGLVDAKMLTKYRKHCLFASVVLAALLPTQDPASLILLTAVVYGLYEFGVVLMRFMPASRVATGWWNRQNAKPRSDGELDDES